MQAGKLNSRVTLQQQSEEFDELGQPLTTWTDVATIWADIRNMGGIESIKADATASVVKSSIRIRYRTGVTAGMRVLHGSTAYNITAVLPDVSGKRFVDLVCEVTS